MRLSLIKGVTRKALEDEDYLIHISIILEIHFENDIDYFN